QPSPRLVLESVYIPHEDHARIEQERPNAYPHAHRLFVITSFGVYHEDTQHEKCEGPNENVSLEFQETVALADPVVQRERDSHSYDEEEAGEDPIDNRHSIYTRRYMSQPFGDVPDSRHFIDKYHQQYRQTPENVD